MMASIFSKFKIKRETKEQSDFYKPDLDYLTSHIAKETHILVDSSEILRDLYERNKPQGKTVRILTAKASVDDAYELAVFRREEGYYHVCNTILDILAKAKYPKAFISMAENYRHGLGVLVDENKADELENKALGIWEEMAASGDARALFDLGVCYRRGEGVHQDNSKAVYYYSLAYEKGCGEAALNLGLLYNEGVGVKQDPEKAYELFEAAANSGISDGFTLMGRQHYSGIGREVDYDAAVKLFLKAAEFEEGDALYHLGCCYVNGYGVPQDNKKAIEYFYRSANAGIEDAKEVLIKNGFPYPIEAEN